jgi:hypothetical protein
MSRMMSRIKEPNVSRLPAMPVDFLTPDELQNLGYWVPSPAEISRRSQEIQANWSAAERRKRAVMASCVQLLPVRLAIARGVSLE